MPIENDKTAILDRLRAFPTATLYDGARRLGLDGTIGLLPITSQWRMVGRAVTVRYRKQGEAGKTLNLYDIIAAAPPDSVIVVELGDDRWMAGNNVVSFSIRNKIAGLLVDGCLRDLAEVREAPLPIFCRGPAVSGYGALYALDATGVPVTCRGVVVGPGDYIAADLDGAIAIPAARANDVLYQAEEIDEIDRTHATAIRENWPLDRLKANGARWHTLRR